MPDYGNPLYWQERYAYDPSASFDWYVTWESLRPVLEHAGALNRRLASGAPSAESAAGDDDFEIFVPGCGNSTLPARLHADGFPNVSCVDISSVVVSQLRDRYAAYPEMDFSVLDAADMPRGDPPDECFDLVLDKALLDAVLCGDDAFRRASSLVRGVHRILKPGGCYAVVSYGPPATRLAYLCPPGVEWEGGHPAVMQVPKPRLEGFKEPAGAPTCYYAYLCRKKGAGGAGGGDGGAGGGGGGGQGR
jgi:EEF1A lysine methyltransferase 4